MVSAKNLSNPSTEQVVNKINYIYIYMYIFSLQQQFNTDLKVVSATFLLVCFFFFKLGEMLFISIQKLFSFSRKSNLSILDFQIS